MSFLLLLGKKIGECFVGRASVFVFGDFSRERSSRVANHRMT